MNATRLVSAEVPWVDGLGRFLSMMLVLNTILCLFNLIPMPPLDGASAVTLLLPVHLGTRLRDALRQPGLALIGLLVVWFGFGKVVRPVFAVLVDLVHL
jgi:Zn-dependent protease